MNKQDKSSISTLSPLATIQTTLFHDITTNTFINSAIKDASKDTPAQAWKLLDIEDTVFQAMSLRLNADDVDFSGKLLTYFNDKQAEYANQVFTVVYCERSKETQSGTSIIGPTVHRTFESALEVPFNYVKGRIFECNIQGEFIEEFNLKIDATSHAEIDKHLCVLDPSSKEDVTDWYFNYQDDDLSEAFYEITEQSIID